MGSGFKSRGVYERLSPSLGDISLARRRYRPHKCRRSALSLNVVRFGVIAFKPRGYILDRSGIVLHPDQGSIEHYYHFLLGYLLPFTWFARSAREVIRIIDCGPVMKFEELIVDISAEKIYDVSNHHGKLSVSEEVSAFDVR